MSSFYSTGSDGAEGPPYIYAQQDVANDDIGSSYADVAFSGASGEPSISSDGTIVTVGQFVSLDVSALATTEDATIKVLVRNSPAGGWRTLGSETACTAGTQTEVYSGNIRAHQMKVQIKYTSSDGGTASVELCLK